MLKAEKYSMTAKTMAGLENILANELRSIGAENIDILHRAVAFKGTKETMYLANYLCRTALRILKPLSIFTVKTENDLYKKIFALKWEDIIDVKNTFAIDTILTDAPFSNSLYISQKAKDAIADRFKLKIETRPDVDIKNPDYRINLYINRQICTVSIDSSGASLHKRGYRTKTGEAPINEVLAAGLISLSGWNFDCNFIDSMCGSGTLLIEAAMLAKNIPAGKFRNDFGFMKWKDFDADLWNSIKVKANSNERDFRFKIIGSDISHKAIENAQQNISNAMLKEHISLSVSSFEDLIPPAEKGILIINPPYGERLKQEKIIEFYKSIGNMLKRNFSGYTAWIISSDIEALKFVGLKPASKIKVFNGPLECRFEKFELYQGSRKKKNLS